MTSKLHPETSANRAGRTRRAGPFALLIMLALAIATALLVTAIVGSLGEPPSSATPVTGGDPLASTGTGAGAAPLPGDGRLGGGVTVFDDGEAAIANLDPALLDAVRRAATDAEAAGIAFVVNSGWRSAEYQDELLQDAIAEYGSAEEAARWVATAATSPHVQGDAIDLGWWEATTWLSEHGAAYGLCQIYANESWHFELRPEAVDDGCPEPYADPTEDPRMQR
ncbi:M15 family metallopeptidase [Agromyces sp. NPDC057679]|uniref:M15 family metallopeptidase n=1 Tax=Agromyces sp. NPDC057679 TaxID=3346207 RepID=UPI003672AD7C